MYNPAIDPAPWTNAMGVFDGEAELADQDAAGRWFTFAQAGATLQESRALAAFLGRVN